MNESVLNPAHSSTPFSSRNAQVDAAAVKSLPNSRKVYVQGSSPDIQVPMREISQSDTAANMGVEKNPHLRVRHLRPLYRSCSED